MIKNLKKKAGVCVLTALLTCVLCAAPAFAMENNGEAGITPDPPPQTVDPIEPSDPEPPPVQSDPGFQSTPSVTDPSDPVVSEPNPSTPSEPDTPVSSGGQSSHTSQTSRPHTTSSRVVYSDPDPTESYVEYIPPNRGSNTNQNNHTTSAQAPVAVAPTEKNTELLSSQNWEELLQTSSSPSGTSSPASSLPPIDGIFSQKEDAYSASIVLIVGIILLVCGAAGVAFFIYSQFIYKRRKAKQQDDDFDDNDYYDDDFPPSGSDREETSPLPYVPTERDISSFSDPNMKPPNPLQNPEPPTPPKTRNHVQIEDIDWDQFFKDNNNNKQ